MLPEISILFRISSEFLKLFCALNYSSILQRVFRYNYKYPYGTDFGGVTMMSAHNYQVVCIIHIILSQITPRQ